MQILSIYSQKMPSASFKHQTSSQIEAKKNMYAISQYKGSRGLASFELYGLKKFLGDNKPAFIENEFMRVLDNKHLCTDFMNDRQMRVFCDYFKDNKDFLKKHFIDTRFKLGFSFPPAWCYNETSFTMLNDILAENGLLREFYETPINTSENSKEKFISDYLDETCKKAMLKKFKEYAPDLLHKAVLEDDGSLLKSLPQKTFNEILYFLGIQYERINSGDALKILEKYISSKKIDPDTKALYNYLSGNNEITRMQCEY